MEEKFKYDEERDSFIADSYTQNIESTTDSNDQNPSDYNEATTEEKSNHYDDYDYSDSSNSSSNNKNMIYVLVGVAIIVIISVVLALVFDKNKGSNKSIEDIEKDMQKQLEKNKKEEEELNKNYEIKETTLLNGYILIEFTNKNKKYVNASFKVDFYDSSNNVVDTKDAYAVSVAPNSKTYTCVYVFGDTSKYASHKINTSLTKSSSDYTYTDKIQILSTNVVGDTITVQIKNNASKKIKYIHLASLFYDEAGNIIGYSSDTADSTDPGQTSTLKIYVPYDKNYNVVKYSKYDVFVDSAFNDN